MVLQVTGPVQSSVRDSMYSGEEGVVEYKEDNRKTDCIKSRVPCMKRTLVYDRNIPQHGILQKHCIM